MSLFTPGPTSAKAEETMCIEEMTPYESNPYNPRPSRDKIIQELARECERTRECDGCKTHPVRIWIIRRALEYLR